MFSDSIMSTTDITASINSIPILNDSNFKSWQENLSIVLAVMDLDLALRVDFSLPLTNENTPNDNRDMKRWEISNSMCILIMKKTIPKLFRGSMPARITTTKEFLAKIRKGFVKNEMTRMSTLDNSDFNKV